MALINHNLKENLLFQTSLNRFKKSDDVGEVPPKSHNPNLYPLHSFAFSVP
jgi:hypothetical protein